MAGGRDKPGEPEQPKAPPADEALFGTGTEEWESDLAAWDIALPIASGPPAAGSGSEPGPTAARAGLEPGAMPDAENPFAATPVTLVATGDPRVAAAAASSAEAGGSADLDDGGAGPASDSYAALVTTVAGAPSEAIRVGLAPDPGPAAPAARLPGDAPGEPGTMAPRRSVLPGAGVRTAPIGSRPGPVPGRGRDVSPTVSATAPTPRSTPAYTSAPGSAPTLPSRSPASTDRGPAPGANRPPAPARRERPSRPWPVLPSASQPLMPGARPPGDRSGGGASSPPRAVPPAVPPQAPAPRARRIERPLTDPTRADGPTRVFRRPAPPPLAPEPSPRSATFGIPMGTAGGFGGGAEPDDSYAAIITDEDRPPPTIFDLDPVDEAPQRMSKPALVEMGAAFWQNEGGASIAVTPGVEIAGPGSAYAIALRELLVDELAHEPDVSRRVDLALGAAHLAALAGDDREARAHIDAALAVDVPDSMASAARPGWSAVHRARLMLAERSGELADGDGPGAESLARLAWLPHADQAAYRQLQAEWTLARAASGAVEGSAAARAAATPPGLPKSLAEAELSWRDPAAAAAVLATAGHARPGPLGAALLALAAARSEMARDFQAAAEQRYAQVAFEERRGLVRMGMLRDVARLEPDAAAAAAALDGLLPTFAPSPLKVALARWAARLATRLGRHDEAWALVAAPATLGPITSVLARDRVDLRARARGTPLGPVEAAELLAGLTDSSSGDLAGWMPRPGARALAALNACAWAAAEPALVAAALDRVDELVSGGADADAAACLGAVVEELARRAPDADARRRALATWQRVDAARWLPAAFDLAVVVAPAERESIWREVARRHPESPVFLRLSAALASDGRLAEAAGLLHAGATGWGRTQLAAPLVELSAEVLSAVDLAAACERLEGLVAAQMELGEGEGGARITLGRALRQLGERSSSGDPAVAFSIRDRWTAYARAEPVDAASRARRAALLLEATFWRSPGVLLSDEELLDEALELVPFHPVAIALALASSPDPRTMPRRWLAEGDVALGGRRRIQAAVWMALGGDAAAALAVVSALLPAPVAGTEAPAGGVLLGSGSDRDGRRATSDAEAATVGPAARRFTRRLAWAETSARARGELLARLATGAEATADALVEAADDAARDGDRVRAARLLHRAARAAGAELVAGELRVGLDPLGAMSPAAAAGLPAEASGPAGGPDPLSRLEHAVRELRFADVITCLVDAPPQEQAPDAPTLNLAIEIDDGRAAGGRLAELLARAPRASADAPPPAPDLALAGAQAPLVFRTFAAGGTAATPRGLEAAAAVALDLGDARSAGLLLVEAAMRAEATAAPDAVAERLLRAAVRVDPASAAAAASWRRFLVRTSRLAEASDAAEAEAGTLVDPGLQVQALVRAAALSAMIAPSAPGTGATDLAGPRARAATLLRRALQVAPADVDVFSKLRDVYERTGDQAALAGLLEHRLAHTSNPFEMTALHLARAELLAGPLGDPAAAKAQLLLILGKESQHGRALQRLADLEEEAGNFAQAAELLMQRAAGERSPEKLRELFLRLGRIHTHRAPDPKRAVAAYARVLQLDANNREALDALSILYLGLGETRSASAITERLVRVERSPERRAPYHVRLGQLAERSGDSRATAQYFRRAVAESPRNLQALGELIRFLEKTHDAAGRRHVLDAAAGDLRAAFLARPTDAVVRDAFVAVQRWRGRPAAATAAIELGMLLGLPAPDESSNGEGGSPSPSSAGRRLVALANPAVDDRTFPLSVPSSVRHLFRLVGPFERPGQRADLARFGVDRSHRIAEGRAPRDLLDGIAADLGTGAYELFIAPGAAAPGERAPLAALPVRPPAIVIASTIVKMGPEAIRFAAGRALRLSSSYLDTALAGSEQDLAAWLVGVVRQFVPTYRRDDVPADLTASATSRMARLIPRKSRQEILPFALESSGEIDVKALSLGIREGANRVGVLAGSRLDVAAQVLLAVNGVELSADAVRTHVEVRALVEFCLSDEHDDLVRMLA